MTTTRAIVSARLDEAASQMEGPALLNLVQQLPLPSFVVSPAGHVLYANEAFWSLHGGHRNSPAIHSLFEEQLCKSLVDLASRRATQASFSTETLLHRMTGEKQPVLLYAASGAAGAEYALGQLSSAHLSEQQSELSQRESRWSFALEGAGQGVWDHNLIRETAYYSPAWYRMRGFEPGEDIDAELGPWLQRIHPDDQPAIAAATRRQDSGELRYNAFEYRERHRDGHWIWILSRGKPVERLPTGAVARIVGTDTDITALKQIEGQLGEEKERLRVTLQAIGDGMISTDADGLITFLNPAAEELTGWVLTEAIGQPVKRVLLLALEDGSIPACPVSACLVTKEPVVLEDNVVLVARNRRVWDIRLSSSPLKTPAGALMGTVVVFQDISRSRDLQRQLAHSASHDLLTGLPNRAAFDAALQGASESARQELREHALCYIDLDHFKAVNDGAGHAAGDELLKEIGDLIRKSCRSADFAARIGGDEFVLLLMDCNLHNARRICESLIERIANLDFNWNGLRFRVGASIGIAAVTCRQPSAAQLSGEADAACYAAKRSGRGKVIIHADTQ